MMSVLAVAFAIVLAGCPSPDTTGPSAVPVGQDAERERAIVGLWEWVENPRFARQDPPTETMEFTAAGTFVVRTNGNVEMAGRFRIRGERLVLLHPDEELEMGYPMTIKTLTAQSLILTNAGGIDSELVKK